MGINKKNFGQLHNDKLTSKGTSLVIMKQNDEGAMSHQAPCPISQARPGRPSGVESQTPKAPVRRRARQL